MQRYIWVLVFALIAVATEVCFFHSIFTDGAIIKKQKKSKKNLLVNCMLVVISVVCILLATYLYFDIQTQLKLLESL